MTLIDLPATAYQTPRGWAVVVGGFATEAEARRVAGGDLNALHERGVLEGRAQALARLRARGAGYRVLADEIKRELKGE